MEEQRRDLKGMVGAATRKGIVLAKVCRRGPGLARRNRGLARGESAFRMRTRVELPL